MEVREQAVLDVCEAGCFLLDFIAWKEATAEFA